MTQTQSAPETLAEQKRKLITEKLIRELGPTIMEALSNPKIVEIMLNPDGVLWFDVLGEGMVDSGTRIQAAKAENMLGTIAAMLETTITRENPVLQGELPIDGSRVQGLIRPIVTAPAFAIRKRAGLVFTLDNYVEKGILDPGHCDEIRKAVRNRENILIVGSTGSGKTTLANAILDDVAKVAGGEQRVLIIEDTVELQCAAPNVLAMRTSDFVDTTGCLKAAMRLRPDRIVVGEVRDHAALALLKAWNTGHPGGLCTVHANSAAAGLLRVEQLIAEAKNIQAQPHLIAEAVNVIVFITRTKTGRRVSELVRTHGLDNNGNYVLEEIAPTNPVPQGAPE